MFKVVWVFSNVTNVPLTWLPQASLDLILNVCSQRQRIRLNVPKMRILLMSYL